MLPSGSTRANSHYRSRAGCVTRFTSDLYRSKPCVICGRRPSDAHHLRFAQLRALGRKVSDEYTVPVCRSHHREIHRSGDEASWWERAGIDPVAIARQLWTQTHPVPGSTEGTNADVAGPTIPEAAEPTNSKLIHRSISRPGFASRNPFEVTLPMASLKQIEANRRNALKSTGPRSEEGKQISRRNAVRHGLTAETVIEGLEDPEDYKAFEAAVTSDYEAQSAAERELVLRLASLLWRLRRATSIETGLLQIQQGAWRAFKEMRRMNPQPNGGLSNASLGAPTRRKFWRTMMRLVTVKSIAMSTRKIHLTRS